MLEQSLQLRVGAIFEIFVISAIGAYLPVYLADNCIEDTSTSLCKVVDQANALVEVMPLTETPIFRGLKCFSGGLVVAVAFCHLLADSVGDLSDDTLVKGTPGYPFAMSLAMTGVIFLVFLEQMTIAALEMVGRDDSDGRNERHIQLQSPSSILSEGNGCEEGPLTGISCNPDGCNFSECLGDHDAVVEGYNEVVEHAAPNPRVGGDPVKEKQQLLQLIIFECAVALHSVIIGFDLGILSADSLSKIKTLMIALSFHQFFEGFSLGTMIVGIKMPPEAKIIFSLAFAITTPIGIVIGILTENTTSSDHAKGIANGLAGGFLIYAGLVEILHEEFSKLKPDKSSVYDRPIMCFCMMLGASFMAILAIWA